MKITVVGSGHVGLVAGACFAEAGNHVLCLDIDRSSIERLANGQLSLFEPGLADLLRKNREAGRLGFTASYSEAVDHADVFFLAVGTPELAGGGADLHCLLSAAQAIGRRLTRPAVIVNKSTAPVGTAERLERLIAETLRRRGVNIPFAVASNPEFMREGAAIDDFRRPERVLIGSEDAWAVETLRTLYAPFAGRGGAIMVMDRRSAELAKYAANAMLATRISFMNELAGLAAELGADIKSVQRGLGSDARIGPHFLAAGAGYGGGCLPKDIRALIRMGEDNGLELGILKATERANERQKRILFRMIHDFYAGRDGLRGRTFAVWGISFKPETDDIREAPSLALIEELVQAGSTVRAYDPAALQQARSFFGGLNGLQLCESADDALAGSDSLVIVTEWKEFRDADPGALAAALRDQTIFDGRGLFDRTALAAHGLRYFHVGRKSARNLPVRRRAARAR